jgi:hypothetical protein
MEHADDELATMEFEDPDVAGLTKEDAREAMVDALRRGNPSPEDHMIADAIEAEGTYIAHQQCVGKTKIPEMPTAEDN